MPDLEDEGMNLAAYKATQAFDMLLQGFPPCFVQKFVRLMNQSILAIASGFLDDGDKSIAQEVIAALDPIMKRELARCEAFKNN